jgi:hypothetical protein
MPNVSATSFLLVLDNLNFLTSSPPTVVSLAVRASMAERKPQLHLLDVKRMSAEKLAKFFAALTGREVPSEQMDELRELVEEIHARTDQQRAELVDKDRLHE